MKKLIISIVVVTAMILSGGVAMAQNQPIYVKGFIPVAPRPTAATVTQQLGNTPYYSNPNGVAVSENIFWSQYRNSLQKIYQLNKALTKIRKALKEANTALAAEKKEKEALLRQVETQKREISFLKARVEQLEGYINGLHLEQFYKEFGNLQKKIVQLEGYIDNLNLKQLYKDFNELGTKASDLLNKNTDLQQTADARGLFIGILFLVIGIMVLLFIWKFAKSAISSIGNHLSAKKAPNQKKNGGGEKVEISVTLETEKDVYAYHECLKRKNVEPNDKVHCPCCSELISFRNFKGHVFNQCPKSPFKKGEGDEKKAA